MIRVENSFLWCLLTLIYCRDLFARTLFTSLTNENSAKRVKKILVTLYFPTISSANDKPDQIALSYYHNEISYKSIVYLKIAHSYKAAVLESYKKICIHLVYAVKLTIVTGTAS